MNGERQKFIFLEKWSCWFIGNKNYKELRKAFGKELNGLIKEENQSIISLIDEMIEGANREKNLLTSVLNTAHFQGLEAGLIELKQKIEAL